MGRCRSIGHPVENQIPGPCYLLQSNKLAGELRNGLQSSFQALQMTQINTERRTFQEAWEEEYLFVECPKEKATCLLCKEKVNVLKRYNLERHYKTRHSEYTANFPLNSKLRSAKVASLKQALPSQQKIFHCQMKESEAVTEASFKICYLLAKHKKTFSDAELVKQYFLSAAKILFDNYTNKASLLKEIGALQLSDSTCARRIEAMGQNVQEQVIKAVRESPFFSIAMDESTDIGDVAQLLLWVRYLDQSLHPKEELWCLLPLQGHTRGEDVLDSMCNYFKTNDIPLNTLVSITTDGAPTMVGHDRGFVSMHKKKLIGQTVIDYHCIIHQEVLCAKLKHGELNNVLRGAVKIVNFIRAKSLNHRLFKAMLQESEEEQTDVLMHTDMRWLSKGKVLERFIALLPEIELFVNSKQQLVCSLINGIYAFESKLVLFKEQLDDSDFTHFPKLLAVMQRFPDAQEILANLDPGACLEEISGEIKRRFSQFRALTPLFRPVENPWMVSARNLDVVTLIGMERAQSELELIDMQHNSALEASFLGQAPEEFCKMVPPDKFPLLLTVAQKVLCIFGSTYACECSFSTMGLLKSKLRNKLTDIHLEQLLRLAVSNLVPDYRKRIGDMKCKISS
ncbi:general transcription factor II-I repeat domain-containing protein 2B-like [Lissotriton helveticus]